MIRIGIGALALAVAAGNVAGAAETIETGTHFVYDRITKFVEKGVFAGAVSILYDDGFQETALIGYSDLETKRKPTIDDMFMMYSQTKCYTGVAVAKLVEEGKVKLDDPLSRWLDEFKEVWVEESNTNGVRKLRRAETPITLRMVMNHTSGLPFEVPGMMSVGWNHTMPLRVAAAVAAATPLKFEPGTKYAYSNLGMDVGAAVVQIAARMSFEKFLEEKFFKPLGMKDTTFRPTEEQLSRQMKLYGVGDKAPPHHIEQTPGMQRPFGGPTVVPSAGAGLWSSSRDMLTFFKALMNLGVGDNGVRILKPETITNVLGRAESPVSGVSLGMTAPRPGKDGPDFWMGFQGALSSQCYFNWYRKRLRLWAIQDSGGTGKDPWNGEWHAGENEFFKYCEKRRAEQRQSSAH